MCVTSFEKFIINISMPTHNLNGYMKLILSGIRHYLYMTGQPQSLVPLYNIFKWLLRKSIQLYCSILHLAIL